MLVLPKLLPLVLMLGLGPTQCSPRLSNSTPITNAQTPPLVCSLRSSVLPVKYQGPAFQGEPETSANLLDTEKTVARLRVLNANIRAQNAALDAYCKKVK